MKARQIIMALLLVLSGAVLTLATMHIAHRMHHHHGQSNAGDNHVAMMRELEDKLHMTSAQRDSINAIFQRHQAAVDAAWREIHSHMGAALDSVHREIAQVLDSAQLKQFHKFLRDQHADYMHP